MSGHSQGGGSALIAFTGVGLLGTPIVLMALLAPKYAEVFRDFGVTLPLLTKWFLDFGHALATPLGALAAAAGLLVALVAVYAIARQSRMVGIVVLTLCALWAIAAFVLFMLAMYVPLNELTNSLQRGAGA